MAGGQVMEKEVGLERSLRMSCSIFRLTQHERAARVRELLDVSKETPFRNFKLEISLAI